uniref:hypothetical protein n=1 Tax=Roseateles sp. TaxID=1971397 RepID=UPI00286A56DA
MSAEHFDGFTPPPRDAPSHVAANDPRPEPSDPDKAPPRTEANHEKHSDPLSAFSRFIVTDEQ